MAELWQLEMVAEFLPTMPPMYDSVPEAVSVPVVMHWSIVPSVISPTKPPT